MNKELELEAENYAENTVKQCVDANIYCDEGSLAMGFIAGAISKYVEKQKLKFAIKQLESIQLGLFDNDTLTVHTIKCRIKELEQQLKELEK